MLKGVFKYYVSAFWGFPPVPFVDNPSLLLLAASVNSIPYFSVVALSVMNNEDDPKSEENLKMKMTQKKITAKMKTTQKEDNSKN